MRIDLTSLKLAITNLEAKHPELREDDEAWALALESETDVTEALAKIVTMIDDTKALAGGVAGRIAELELRLRRFENREQALRSLALTIMQSSGLPKLVLPIATLSVQPGRERVEIIDEAAIPDILCTFKRSPDKGRIKSFLTGDNAKPNWAALVMGDPSLTIRTK